MALALLQFTSGSTADPKGVMLPHENVVHNIDAIVEGAALNADDRGVSWLPLYHDMGLIGLLMTPMLTGFDLVLAAPTDFLAAPGDWLRWMSDYRGTVTCAPNFGYALAARALRRLDGLDLSPWRLGLNGAEPIDPDAVERFLAGTGAPHGLDASTALCVYGMAEATLAISFPEPGTGMTVDEVDRDTLEREELPRRRRRDVRAGAWPASAPRCAASTPACATPAPARPRAEREVGELEIRGTSITPGYFRRDDVNAAALHDGWLRTGDLGYLVDGEIVVCGRIKDVIIIGGRNVFPEEIERAAGTVTGVRPGNVVAFGTPGRRGKEGIVVVAETKLDDPEALHDAVIDRVCDAVGVPHSRWSWSGPGACPRRRRASCSGPAAGPSTSTTRSPPPSSPRGRRPPRRRPARPAHPADTGQNVRMPPPASVVHDPTTATLEAARPARESHRSRWRLFAVLLLLTVALRLPGFFVDVFNSDETFLATQAHVIRDGGNLYREAADRKPPLVPYIYAASFEFFGSTALWTVRLVAMLAIALTAWLLACEARRRWGWRAGWIAGLLCVFAMVAFAPQDGQAANFEVFMLPAMTAAVLLAGARARRIVGVAVAVATLAKQTGAATLLPVAYLVWKARGKHGLSRAALGFAIPLGLVAFALGPGQLLYWTVLGNGSYVSVGTASLYVASTFVLMTLAWVACNLPIVWRLPEAWRSRRRPARDGGTDTDLWLWLISAAVSVAVGLRFFGHYYIQLIPPLCLLTAGSLARATRHLARATVTFRGRRRVGILRRRLLHVAVRTGAPLSDGQQVPRHPLEEGRLGPRVGQRPRDLLGVEPAPRERGSSRRRRSPTASRVARRSRPPREVEQLDLGLVLRGHGRAPATVHRRHRPGRHPGAEYTPIDRFPRLEEIVQSEYHYVGAIDGIAIYERQPA